LLFPRPVAVVAAQRTTLLAADRWPGLRVAASMCAGHVRGGSWPPPDAMTILLRTARYAGLPCRREYVCGRRPVAPNDCKGRRVPSVGSGGSRRVRRADSASVSGTCRILGKRPFFTTPSFGRVSRTEGSPAGLPCYGGFADTVATGCFGR